MHILAVRDIRIPAMCLACSSSLRTEERGRGRRGAGDLSRAVCAAVVLGARRLAHGDESEEDIVDLEDILV